MNDLKKIGEKISTRRKKLGLTLEEVGERVGVAKSTIQRYEAGKIASPKQKLRRFLSAQTATSGNAQNKSV